MQTFSSEEWAYLSVVTLTSDFSVSSFENGIAVSSVDELKQKYSKDLKALCLEKMINENYPTRLRLVDLDGKVSVLGVEKNRSTSGDYNTPFLSYYVCETGEVEESIEMPLSF